jgi:transposase
VFFYSHNRRGEHPTQHLTGYAGILQADAYAGFGDLYDGKRRPGPITEAAYWSQGRRHFFELANLRKAPLAVEAVRRIDELFAIERTINGLSASDRLRIRQQQSRPIVADLEQWMGTARARMSRHADTAKAIHYMLPRWSAFTRILDDGASASATTPPSAHCSPAANRTFRRDRPDCGEPWRDEDLPPRPQTGGHPPREQLINHFMLC